MFFMKFLTDQLSKKIKMSLMMCNIVVSILWTLHYLNEKWMFILLGSTFYRTYNSKSINHINLLIRIVLKKKMF